MISSTSNSHIKNIAKLLKSSKARREQGVFLVEGKKMFLEAKELGLIERAFLSEDLYEEWKHGEYLEGVVYDIVSFKIFKDIQPLLQNVHSFNNLWDIRILGF